MSQNAAITTCLKRQEARWKKTTSLNPKADEDAVAEKKRDLFTVGKSP